MDPLSTAISLAQAVRLAIAAIKGESKLVIAARQLMHSCEMYEDCLAMLKKSITEQQHAAAVTGKVNSSDEQLEKSVLSIYRQVEDDQSLLRSILHETGSIEKTSKSYHVITNAMISHFTGRVEKIKSLENELLSRVKLITALMMKDVWRVTQGADIDLMNEVGDVDGALHWRGHFGGKKWVTFGRFIEAYQAYLTNTFLFRKLAQKDLITLLRHTLLDEPISAFRDSSQNNILATEVTLQSFSIWLQRFGPMKDTLTKCAAVTIPSNGAPALWYHKALPRDHAEGFLVSNQRSLSPHHAIVLRFYTRDDAAHFVVSVRPHKGTSVVEHYSVLNSAMGYKLQGSPHSAHCENLHQFLHSQILVPLFPTEQVHQELSTEGMNEWSKIFDDATTELPADHYKDIESLNKAVAAAERSVTGPLSAGTGLVISPKYSSLFSIQPAASPPNLRHSSSVEIADSESSATFNSSGGCRSVVGSCGGKGGCSTVVRDKKDIENAALYMIEHGVFLLKEQKSMSEADAAQILNEVMKLLNR